MLNKIQFDSSKCFLSMRSTVAIAWRRLDLSAVEHSNLLFKVVGLRQVPITGLAVRALSDFTRLSDRKHYSGFDYACISVLSK